MIHKLLTSAVDNAKYVSQEKGIDLDVDNLYVKQAIANDGPRMKRIRPAPMGRAYRYQRRIVAHRRCLWPSAQGVIEPGDQGGGAGDGAAPQGKKTAAKKPAAKKAAASKTAGAAKKSAPKKTAAKKTAKKKAE